MKICHSELPSRKESHLTARGEISWQSPAPVPSGSVIALRLRQCAHRQHPVNDYVWQENQSLNISAKCRALQTGNSLFSVVRLICFSLQISKSVGPYAGMFGNNCLCLLDFSVLLCFYFYIFIHFPARK
jgi:hypothetical protein